MNNIYELITLGEAAKLWDKDRSTIERVVKHNFKMGIDYRKSGGTLLISTLKLIETYGYPLITGLAGIYDNGDFISSDFNVIAYTGHFELGYSFDSESSIEFFNKTTGECYNPDFKVTYTEKEINRIIVDYHYFKVDDWFDFLSEREKVDYVREFEGETYVSTKLLLSSCYLEKILAIPEIMIYGFNKLNSSNSDYEKENLARIIYNEPKSFIEVRLSDINLYFWTLYNENSKLKALV